MIPNAFPTGPARALALLLCVGLVGTAPSLGQAQETELTLERVLLSTGGVGYLEYGAEVQGNAELELNVPLDQVDDVLKSIVVYDTGGGVGQVRLPGREPLAQIFRDLPFGPGALESPSALLNHLQGAEIRTQGSRDLEGPRASGRARDGGPARGPRDHGPPPGDPGDRGRSAAVRPGAVRVG